MIATGQRVRLVAASRFAGVLVLVVAVGASAVARADTAKPADIAKVKALFQQGLTDYNLGHFEAALSAFEEAYRLRQDPAFLFNLAQCQRNLRRYEDAARTYRAYLREGNVSDAERAPVLKLIAEMDDAVQEQRAHQPPTGMKPPAAMAPVESAAPPPEATPAVVATRPRRAWYRSPAGWTFVGGGVACLAVGAAGLGLAAGEHDAAIAATTQATFDRHHASSLQDQQWGWPLLGVGAAALVVGGIVLAVHR